jgi:hypothetical protein
MAHRSLSLATLAFAAAVAGCGDDSSEAEFDFDEGDIRAIAVGTFTGLLELAGRPDTTHDLVIQQAPPESSPQCGNRAFSRPLCIESTTMGLAGRLTSADGAFGNLALQGELVIFGLQLDSGELTLDGDGVSLRIPLEDGELTRGDVRGNVEGTISLERR